MVDKGFIKGKKGLVLVTVFAVLFALTTMLGALLLAIYYRYNLLLKRADSVQAYYLALAGIRYADGYPMVYSWYPVAFPLEKTFSIFPSGADEITYKIEPVPNTYCVKITSTGKINNTQIKLSYVYGHEDIHKDAAWELYYTPKFPNRMVALKNFPYIVESKYEK